MNIGNKDTRHSSLAEYHMKSKEKREDDVPTVSLDYGYMGETVNMRDKGLPSPVLCGNAAKPRRSVPRHCRARK